MTTADTAPAHALPRAQLADSLTFYQDSSLGPPIVKFSQLVEAIPTLNLPELTDSQIAALPAFILYTAELERLKQMNSDIQDAEKAGKKVQQGLRIESERTMMSQAMNKIQRVVSEADTNVMRAPTEIGATTDHVNLAFIRILTLKDKKQLAEFARLSDLYRKNLAINRKRAAEIAKIEPWR